MGACGVLFQLVCHFVVSSEQSWVEFPLVVSGNVTFSVPLPTRLAYPYL